MAVVATQTHTHTLWYVKNKKNN